MRVVLIGAGAIGGYLAAKLATAGSDITVLARDATLDALRRKGIEVRGIESISAPIRAVADVDEAGPADLVVTCLKGYSIPRLAPAIRRLLGAHGVWLSALNGLPWWYGEGLAAPLSGIILQSVDPHGTIAATIGPGRTLGGVLYLRSEVLEPGVVSYSGGRGLVIGEPDGSASSRLSQVCQLFQGAGVKAQDTANIRAAVWSKLFGNVSMNPLSALTGLTADRILDDPVLRRFMAEVMEETQRLAAAVGQPPEMTVDQRLTQMRELGQFRTSMLQDALAGRPLEHDAIIGSVVELGRRSGVPMPKTELLFALIRSFAETRGLLPPPA